MSGNVESEVQRARVGVVRPVVMSLTMMVASTALADNTADEADLAFSRGVAAWTRRDYESALSNYFLSHRLVPNRNVLFNIARCFEALDRQDEAYRYWHDLSVDPKLPAADLKEVKSALARLAPRVALITVSTTPTEGHLYLDREDLGSRGTTPQTVAVRPGAHLVIIKADGFRPAAVNVTALRGQDAKVSVELSRIVGTVDISGTPSGAVVRETADGPELGRLPARLTFPPGQRLFLVQAPGHLPQQVLVTVKAEAVVSAYVTLPERPKPTGKVIVTANREAALVRVDGKDSGFTPVVLNLAEGTHQLEVTSADVSPFTQRIEVVADHEVRLDADLRYAPPRVTAASKQLLSVDQAPASTTVVTREEIQTFGYQTLPEALRAVRGLFFTDDRIYTYIGVRGFAPQGDLNTRILLLWDGHPMNDVWAGQGFSARDFDVDLNEVDRIEVVRGPASLLFGTGAFFGVINVVPRARVENGHVQGVVGAGAAGGVKARVTGSLGTDAASAIVSAAGFTSTGAELTDLGAAGAVKGLDGERALGANAKARYKGLTLTAKWNQRKKQVPTAPHPATLGAAGTEYTDARGFSELRYEQEFFSRLTFTARAAYDASRYRGFYATIDANGDTSRSTDTGGGDWLSGEARGSLIVSEGNRLTLSLEGQVQFVYQQPADLVERTTTTRTFFSATLLDEWLLLGNRLFLQAGVRADRYNDIGEFALSPRGAVVARLYETGLTKLVAGRAFRAPTPYELYFNDLSRRAPATGTLTPEYITTFELEHSHNVTPELRATLGGYYNLIDRLVLLREEAKTPPACGNDMQCFVYTNASAGLTALGAEAQLRWQPGRFTLVEGTYSFVVLGGPGVGDAPAYPSHLASARAMIPLKQGLVRLSGQATYQSGRRQSAQDTPVGESLVLNFGVSGDFQAVRYFAGVQNLLDQRALLPVVSDVGAGLIPQYGRTFWLELTATF
jgi:outer membrane receptor for ferrienterochelin and colicins